MPNLLGYCLSKIEGNFARMIAKCRAATLGFGCCSRHSASFARQNLPHWADPAALKLMLLRLRSSLNTAYNHMVSELFLARSAAFYDPTKHRPVIREGAERRLPSPFSFASLRQSRRQSFSTARSVLRSKGCFAHAPSSTGPGTTICRWRKFSIDDRRRA